MERVTEDGKSIASASMNLQFYTSAAAYLTDGKLDEAAFKINAVRLEILGDFGEDFSYHFRQSFNKYSNPHVLDNLSSSVECALVNWNMNKRFTLTVGKQALQLGGYEYWVNSIKVREFSDFNNNVACYQAGVNGAVNLSPTQQLNLQIVNNRSGDEDETFLYGRPEEVGKVRVPMLSTANWDGYFFDRGLNLRYSVSWGQLADKRNILYLTAGNVWKKGPVVAYVDLMYSREGLDSKGLISELSAGRKEVSPPSMSLTLLRSPTSTTAFMRIGICMPRALMKREVFTRQTVFTRRGFIVVPGMCRHAPNISL